MTCVVLYIFGQNRKTKYYHLHAVKVVQSYIIINLVLIDRAQAN